MKTVILILVVTLLGGGFFYLEKSREAERERQAAIVANQLKEINTKVDEVKKRDAELYPKLNASIAKINTNINTLKKTRLALEASKPTKEKTYEKFKNASIVEISKYFADNGVPNTVVQ